MHIAPVIYRTTPKFGNIQPFNNCPNNNSTKSSYSDNLPHDTVSFTAAKFSTGVRDSWAKQFPRLGRIGTAWLDAWEAVAVKLKENGVSFIREMFESKAVKTPDSQEWKMLRHKTFERRDLIRTTAFVKNPYDLKVLFNNIIPELGIMGNRGYYIAPVMKSVGDLIKRGYVPVEEEKIVSEILENPLSKSYINKIFNKLEKIKYEFPFKHYTLDYGNESEIEQIRYNSLKVNRQKYNFDETKKLLLEFVKEGKAITREDFINIVKSIKKEVPDVDVRLKQYTLRKTFDTNTLPEDFRYCIGEPHGTYEDIQARVIRDCDKDNLSPIFHEFILHFGPTYNVNASIEHKIYESLRLFETLNIDTTAPSFNSPASRINGCIESIQKLIRREISEKLLENGKNADFYGMDGEISIKIGEDVIDDFNTKFDWLTEELSNHYTFAKRAARKVSNASFKMLDKDYKADKALIERIRRELDGIIKEFNHKYGLKDNG